MSTSMLKSILLSRVTIGFVVSVVAELLKAHGIAVDQSGLTDDIVAGIGLAVSASGHIKTVKGLTNAKTALGAAGVDPEHAATTGEATAK